MSPADVGDWNGDGVHDLAVGAMEWRSARDSGVVLIVDGRSGSTLREIRATAEERALGASTIPLRDRDGDALPELLITGRSHAVIVSSGSGRRLLEVEARVVSWRSVVAAGPDVDRDGVQDLLTSDLRIVRAISGVDGRTLWENEIAHWSHDFTCTKLVIPDVDDDGLEDVAVGWSKLRNVDGRVEFRSGRDGRVLFVVTPSDTKREKWREGWTWDGFGSALARFERGGRCALVVSGSRKSVDGGAVVLDEHGRDQLVSMEEPCRDSNTTMGWDVDAGGDFDGDGQGDVLVTRYSPYCTNDPAQGAIVFSGRDGALLHSFEMDPDFHR